MTSTMLYLGNHGNLLEDSRTACQLIRFDGPMLTKDEFDRICAIDRVGFKAQRFSATYRREDGENALEQALENLACSVEKAVRNGVTSWRAIATAAEGEVPIPSLLAVSSVTTTLFVWAFAPLPISWLRRAMPFPHTTSLLWLVIPLRHLPLYGP